jgi:hypothetical protein
VIRPRQVRHLGDLSHFFSLLVLDGELTKDEAVTDLLVAAADAEVAVLDGVADLGPILVAFDSATFHNGREHYDECGLTFPRHEPKVDAGCRQWSLSCNIP